MEPGSELRQYYEKLRGHKSIIALVIALAMGGVMLQLAIQPPQYQGDVSMLITPQLFASNPTQAPDLNSLQSDYRYVVINDILYLAKSDAVLRQVADRVGGGSAGTLAKRVTVKNLDQTDILLISAKDPDPARAALIANTTSQELVDYYVHLNRSAATGARRFISEQLDLTRDRLQNAERALKNFKSRANVVDLPAQVSNMIQRVFEMQTTYNTAILDEKTANQRVAAIRQQLRSENDSQLASVEITTNPVVGQLRDRLVALELDLANLRQLYTDRYPKVQQTLGQIADVQNRLRQEAAKVLTDQSLGVSPLRAQLVQQLMGAQVDVTAAQARASAVGPIVAKMQAGLSAMPADELTFARLQRDVNLNEANYTRLSSLYQDALLVEQKAGFAGQAAIVVVDKAAAPARPVSNQLPLKAGLAGLLGLILGSALALLVDELDNRVRFPRQVEGTYGVPVLASVPTMNAKSYQRLVTPPSSAVAGFVVPFLLVILIGALVSAGALLVVHAGLILGKTVLMWVSPMATSAMAHVADISGKITVIVASLLTIPM